MRCGKFRNMYHKGVEKYILEVKELRERRNDSFSNNWGKARKKKLGADGKNEYSTTITYWNNSKFSIMNG